MGIEWREEVEVDYGNSRYSLEELYQGIKERLKKEGLLDTDDNCKKKEQQRMGEIYKKAPYG